MSSIFITDTLSKQFEKEAKDPLEKIKNKGVVCESLAHGKEIREFFESIGVSTIGFGMDCVGGAYGIRLENGAGSISSPLKYVDREDSANSGIEFATLDDLKKLVQDDKGYPKVMYVSDFEILKGSCMTKRVVFMEKAGKYIAWKNSETLQDSESKIHTSAWKYAVDLDFFDDKEEIVELTIRDISEGKGAGVPEHLIRIKK